MRAFMISLLAAASIGWNVGSAFAIPIKSDEPATTATMQVPVTWHHPVYSPYGYAYPHYGYHGNYGYAYPTYGYSYTYPYSYYPGYSYPYYSGYYPTYSSYYYSTPGFYSPVLSVNRFGIGGPNWYFGW